MPGLGLALTLLSLGGQAIGAAKSAQENNRIYQKLMDRSSTLDSVFNKEYNMDYMQTPGVKNTMSAYLTGLKDIQKNAEGRAVMSGATPEAVIAQKESMNQNYGDFVRKVAAGQDAYRQNKENTYMARRDNMDQQIMGFDKEKAARWGNFSSNAAQLGVAGIMADSMPGAEGAEPWYKQLFNKKSAGVIPAGDVVTHNN